MHKKSEAILFILLMLVLIPLEVLCAFLAYETLGEISSLVYLLLVGLNLVPIVLAFRNRITAALGAIALALAIIPYQLVLGDRLLRVQAEAARVVTYAYEYKVNTGQFPPDLAQYQFHDPDMKAFIQKYQPDNSQDGFALYYRVGTESTSHSYSTANGWGYYPD